jgi:hypothetical protein
MGVAPHPSREVHPADRSCSFRCLCQACSSGFWFSVWLVGGVGLPRLDRLVCGAGSGLPARSLLDREMLHERWAAASGPTAPPSKIGMRWSA